jgi:hypothetical protein
MLELGRVAEARELLLQCKSVYQEANHLRALSSTFSALAQLEEVVDRPDRALDLEAEALRLKYLAGDPDYLIISHANMAVHLIRLDADPRAPVAHLLAAAVLCRQLGSGRLASVLWDLSVLADGGGLAYITSFADLCETVGEVPGVQLAEVVARLAPSSGDGDAVLAQVLALVEQMGSPAAG